MTVNKEIDIHKDCVSIKDHLLMLVQETNKRTTDVTFERDRRYAEVNIEKEKALKIKDEGDREARRIKDNADTTALMLAREIQTYKDEKSNNLREQISSERGLYATKEDVIASSDKTFAMIKPLIDYVSSQQGRNSGLNQGWIYILGGFSLIATVLAIIGFFKP